jgi:hypothetical protein
MSGHHRPVRTALDGKDVVEFLDGYFGPDKRTLFIGNVGFNADAMYFPLRMASKANVDFRFMFERRPDVPQAITSVAGQRQAELETLLGGRIRVEPVDICAPDGAPLAGRNACLKVETWIKASPYTDVVLDATGMSRGTCFPAAKLLVEAANSYKFRVHLLAAHSNRSSPTGIKSVSGDRGDWIHGFQGEVDTDANADAPRLWVVQLNEGADAVLSKLYNDLATPSEVCPIVPFPSADPRRGDKLLFDLRQRWRDDWNETPLSLIYAHEADPTDVYQSIVRLHEARQQALRGAAVQSVTILSPLGPRLPSIGMLLAAQEYSLPLYYLETVGYTVSGTLTESSNATPDHLWCFRFQPS